MTNLSMAMSLVLCLRRKDHHMLAGGDRLTLIQHDIDGVGDHRVGDLQNEYPSWLLLKMHLQDG